MVEPTTWDGDNQRHRHGRPRARHDVGPGDLPSTPSWAPDGSKFAFAKRIADNGDYDGLEHAAIFVYEVATGQTRQVTHPEDAVLDKVPEDPPVFGHVVSDFAPAFSPDGTTIAFVRHVQGHGPGRRRCGTSAGRTSGGRAERRHAGRRSRRCCRRRAGGSGAASGSRARRTSSSRTSAAGLAPSLGASAASPETRPPRQQPRRRPSPTTTFRPTGRSCVWTRSARVASTASSSRSAARRASRSRRRVASAPSCASRTAATACCTRTAPSARRPSAAC